MELTGRIKVILDTQTFDSGFQKREFVVTTQEQYPQDIKFELIRDKITLLDGMNPGEEITVQFNIRGNEYNGRYYVNLQAWRVQKSAPAAGGAAAPPADGGFPQEAPPAAPVSNAGDDDLPF
ncbi:MAG: DUF3127 domain-containing protein [Salibacteraceae bacterium]